MDLDISEFGRPITWLLRWSWYGGKAYGYCLYSSFNEAVKHAIWSALGNVEWSKFPDPTRGSYPYEDRDGSDVPVLTPKFRVTWDSHGGGYAEVVLCEVESKFAAANIERVEEILSSMQARVEEK